MKSFKFLTIQDIQREEGLVTRFCATVEIDNDPYEIQNIAGGNSIYMQVADRGIRLCFASQNLESNYIQKMKLIHAILPNYVPQIYEEGKAIVIFSSKFQQSFSAFVRHMSLPKSITEKYNLLQTISNNSVTTDYMVIEHFEITNRADPFHRRIKIDDLRYIINTCLDAGIYVGYVPRISNVVNTKNGIKYLDFDEWVVIDNELFTRSCLQNNII